MAVTMQPMSAPFSWDSGTKGSFCSAFLLGYTVTNLVGGYVATRFPPKTVLAIGAAVWSISTVTTPLSALYLSGNLPVLLFCRASVGLGEGVSMPCIQNLVACNVPHSKKSRSLGLVSSGIQE